ncbi:YajQ family cyclic di-GMP-binding protein [Candidatus Pelagibacter sp.]|nr:YajQ family cyclic di-GMP-binding protein [Candidatus Pelagibacter sp.]
MPSFDVISKINHQEFDNALSNCLREISNRFDFKGLHISIDRKDKLITTIAPDELKLKQVNELLQTHLIRRKVDPRVVSMKSSESASGGSIRQISELKEGISQENAKKVIADIKKLKLKIQIKIQGDELRVDGKKKDDLQEAISAIKSIDIGLPIEFVNFRD